MAVRAPGLVAALLVCVASAAAVPPAERPSVMAPLAAAAPALGLARSGERVVGVGDRGHVLVSEDGGLAWSQVQAPVAVMLTDVAALPGGVVLATGHGGVVIRSADGGAVWERVLVGDENEPLFSVAGRADGRCVAVGAFGSLAVSADAGRTWETARREDGAHLYAVRWAPDGAAWLAGEAGVLARSEDGVTWEDVEAPYDGTFYGLLADEAGVVVCGLRGRAFASRDGGATWSAFATATTDALFTVVRLPDGALVFGGIAGLRLGNADNTAFRPWPAWERGAVAVLLDVGDGALVAGGEKGVVRLGAVGR